MILLLSLAAEAGLTEDLDAITAALGEDHSGLILVDLADGTRRVRSHGRTAPDRPEPLSEDDLVWLGSISKQFTAAAALSLVDAGALSLDQPVAGVFPELSALSRDGEHCTVSRLLKATCGLPRSLGSPVAHANIATDPDVQARFLADLEGVSLEFAPGTAHLYSNAGYDLAGLMVSRVAGAPVDAVLAPLLARAGMADTGTDPSAVSGFDDRVAWGQLYLLGPAWSGRWLRMGPDIPTQVGAAGNVFGTAADMVRWTRALHSGALLSAEGLAAMTAPAHEDYAMGLVVEGAPGSRLIWHNGALVPHGYNTAAAWIEELDAVVVVLNNQGPKLPSGNATRLMQGLVESLRGEDVALDRLRTTGLDRWKGTAMGAITALLGPGMLLAALIGALQPPKHGRLVWVSGAVTISVGGVLGMTALVPLPPAVLGLAILTIAAAMVSRLQRTAGQPLVAAEKRGNEWANIVMYAAILAFFLLAPVSTVQARFTAAVLTVVAGVELWRGR